MMQTNILLRFNGALGRSCVCVLWYVVCCLCEREGRNTPYARAQGEFRFKFENG